MNIRRVFLGRYIRNETARKPMFRLFAQAARHLHALIRTKVDNF
ncbi:hypothetical protein BBM1454_02580 [Bifidobacterium breve MCC 1454]|nr:hypothetical protein BBM1094_06885 [Bifidobacterium breve MCC 1094]KOA57071.1 hypothetical protein BBM1454_02580 [Bifidobacterium breve MCC 1454]KOA60138.1 hypothetical protein BBM0305_01430 [Bifidobacterium breve MCC 0305]